MGADTGRMAVLEINGQTASSTVNGVNDQSNDSLVRDALLADVFDARVHGVEQHESKCPTILLRHDGDFINALIDEAFSDQASVDTAPDLTPESLVRVLAWSSPPLPKTNGLHTAQEQSRTIRIHRFTVLSSAKPNIAKSLVSHGAPGEQLQTLNLSDRSVLNTRLDNRLLDVRVAATAAIFKLSSGAHDLAVQFLSANGFHFVPTPTLINYDFPGEEGLQFELPYFGDRPAWLTQTGEVHLGMALSADLGRVYDLHTVFRREEGIDARHLTEFTMCEAVFTLKEDWTEIVDMAEKLLIHLVTNLQEREEFVRLSRAARRLYPRVGTLKLGLNAKGQLLRITFAEAKRILRENVGLETDLAADLSSAEEAALGEYLASPASTISAPTDIFVVTNFPRHLRSFSIHPTPEDDSASFDVILRGQEVITGCQLLHDWRELRKAMVERDHPIDPDCEQWKPYTEAHEIGMPPWGGFGMGLNRFVQGLVGLKDIRETVLFPRDAERLAP